MSLFDWDAFSQALQTLFNATRSLELPVTSSVAMGQDAASGIPAIMSHCQNLLAIDLAIVISNTLLVNIRKYRK